MAGHAQRAVSGYVNVANPEALFLTAPALQAVLLAATGLEVGHLTKGRAAGEGSELLFLIVSSPWPTLQHLLHSAKMGVSLDLQSA